MPRRRAWTLYLSLLTVICAADLATKAWVWKLLAVETVGHPPRVVREATRDMTVIPGFFDLEANYNYGAFNGWFGDYTSALAVLSAVALIVITVIVAYVLRKPEAPSAWFISALGLIAGGTAGNLYDRAVDAAVRDWIKWYVVIDGKPHVWPNFNIADSGICVGVAILIVLELLGILRARREEKTAAAQS